MIINGREIGPGHPPFLIAELSANHAGSLERALRLIEAAKQAGADAIKFQAYEPSTITIDCDRPDFILQDGPWKGRKLWDLYAEAHTPLAWFPALAEHAAKVGITWISSVFDRSSVDLLDGIGCPAFKIASFELVDTPLIRYAASKGKPMILSTGMASSQEIGDAVIAANHNAWVLHCVSGYPTDTAEANLGRMKKGTFFPNPDVPNNGYWCPFHGISDHTTGIEVPIAATALGAAIIEKHFMLADGTATPDSAFSLTPQEFRLMADAVRRTWAAMQPSQAPSEAPQRAARRSLYAVADIRAGEPFTDANVRSIRPGHGLPPKEIDNVIGRTAARDIERGEAMAWEMMT